MKKSQDDPCGSYCRPCGASDCGGCQSNVIDDHIDQCLYRQCTKDKGIEFCRFYSKYPCTDAHEFMKNKWHHHWTIIVPYLKFIKKHGKKKWLLAQESDVSKAAVKPSR
jgi:hypothetical protein